MLRFEIALGSEIKYEEFLTVNRECFPKEPVVPCGIFEEYLRDKFWTVRLDGKLVAYSHVSFKESAHIHRIAVIERFRRKGIASRLVEIALNTSKKMSISKITLAVEKSNEAALELYKKHDFEEAGDLFQYIAPLHRRTASDSEKTSPRTRVLSVGDLSETLRAILPSEWDYIVEQHAPPRKFALLFVEGESTIKGITRLVADLPGCSPFILLEPHLDLPSVIDSIGSYLNLAKGELILTFPDEGIARACQKAGFKLQYEMVRMERDVDF